MNKQIFTPANVNTTAKTFELSGIDSTGYTTYVSGGSAENYSVGINLAGGTLISVSGNFPRYRHHGIIISNTTTFYSVEAP